MFFNTTNENGETLRTYLVKANTQDHDVLRYFTSNPNDDQVTPEKVIVYLSQINPRKYDHPTIIISIRRSFNTLKNYNIISDLHTGTILFIGQITSLIYMLSNSINLEPAW